MYYFRPTFSELVEDFDRLLIQAQDGQDYLEIGSTSSRSHIPRFSSPSTGETLIAGNGDFATWNGTFGPQPPRGLPLILLNSSSSSGLGSAEEIMYSPVVASYCNNNLYGIDGGTSGLPSSGTALTEFSTFRPPYEANAYANQNKINQYSDDDDEDEGIVSSTKLVAADEDHSHQQYGDQMESSTTL